MHTEDHFLPGMRWKGKLFTDTALPFGAKVSPEDLHCYSRQAAVDTVQQRGGAAPALLRLFSDCGSPSVQPV